ncbi:hypothetical protein NEMBOFW57_004162 [Staphylotrichum longicolle]|uniref:Uncharacterized protein n=1 Tax=Staphylotrichum longicolle TaxID=669026 RepID=A0AAD4F7F0_9PEZI|nr:hypothetical protein NEMBOFW57_004162 [Staphylotrichum longicolle]
MKSAALLAAALLAVADALPENVWSRHGMKGKNIVAARYTKGKQTPAQPPTLNSPTVHGCYKSSGDLKFVMIHEYNSVGKCGGEICPQAGYLVGGSTGGGLEAFTIYNTGLSLTVKSEGDAESSSSSATPTSTKAPAATTAAPEKTLIVTSTPTETASSEGGTNVAGIVAGVVVGVVVVACAIGGGFLYMRRKRNKEIEEEHRRNAAVSAFVGKSPGSSAGSMTDARLDPVMAQRRLSDGSIADNQDYSRRILRVTNA